jgi:hypothetical protein
MGFIIKDWRLNSGNQNLCMPTKVTGHLYVGVFGSKFGSGYSCMFVADAIQLTDRPSKEVRIRYRKIGDYRRQSVESACRTKKVKEEEEEENFCCGVNSLHCNTHYVMEPRMRCKSSYEL